MDEFKKVLTDPVSRRGFLARMSAAGLGVAAIALLDGAGMEVGITRRAFAAKVDKTGNKFFPGIPGRNINEIVTNFALTLEILEADLYRQALNQASGLPLSTPLAADSSIYTQAVGNGTFSTEDAHAAYEVLTEFTYIEAAHRDFLTMLLQSMGAPTAQPNPGGYKFPGGLGTDLSSILQQILPLEENGVRAYLGGLPYYTNIPNFAATAATIFSTEARHSAVIQVLLGNDAGPTKMADDLQVAPTYPSQNTFEYYREPATVLTLVKPYLA